MPDERAWQLLRGIRDSHAHGAIIANIDGEEDVFILFVDALEQNFFEVIDEAVHSIDSQGNVARCSQRVLHSLPAPRPATHRQPRLSLRRPRWSRRRQIAWVIGEVLLTVVVTLIAQPITDFLALRSVRW